MPVSSFKVDQPAAGDEIPFRSSQAGNEIPFNTENSGRFWKYPKAIDFRQPSAA